MAPIIPDIWDLSYSSVVATATLADVVEKHTSAWFIGPVGWCLESIVVLDDQIAPVRGRQRLWTPPTGLDVTACLTLHPVWAWCVTACGKSVENRTWSPPARLIGKRIGIHAAGRQDELEYLRVGFWLEEHGLASWEA